MEIRLVFLKKDSLPNIYRYFYLKFNEVELVSFYKFTGTGKSVKVLQLFNKKVASLETNG